MQATERESVQHLASKETDLQAYHLNVTVCLIAKAKRREQRKEQGEEETR